MAIRMVFIFLFIYFVPVMRCALCKVCFKHFSVFKRAKSSFLVELRISNDSFVLFDEQEFPISKFDDILNSLLFV